MKKVKNIRNLALGLALLAVTVLISFKAGQYSVDQQLSQQGELNLSLMWKVKAELAKSFLEKDKMVDKDMVYGAVAGMVQSLGDPYTVFLPPQQNQAANQDLAGKFGGVGIQLGYKDSQLAVMAPLAKTPAEKAGIQAGDLILKIIDKKNNIDRDTTGISLEEAVNLIRGDVGSEVTLKMYRDSSKNTFDVTLKRDNIVVPSSELVWKEQNGKKIAWVRLYKFSDQLYKEWPDMVDNINSEKSKLGNSYGGIVLDLRNNPGGFLQASVMVGSDFIDHGVIVEQQSSDGKIQKYEVDPSRRLLLNDKMVVLVNGGSASAAEILSGALKDYKRANLVGENTFGKGTVQQPEDFPDGSGLHVTIAKWLLPNGENIHKIGVKPDIEVKYEVPTVTPTGTPSTSENASVDKPDNQLDKAIEVLLQQ